MGLSIKPVKVAGMGNFQKRLTNFNKRIHAMSGAKVINKI
jgi:hypothetical protein